LQVAYPKIMPIQGGLYHIWSRNFNLGVFRKGRFIGIREKFGSMRLDCEHNFNVKEFLEQCPTEVLESAQFNLENIALFNWLSQKVIQYGSKIQ
jgi:hypothetical protein